MAQTNFRRAAILGAGVMGAQIAAHLANAGIDVMLFELADENDPNGPVQRAITALHKLKPSPLAEASVARRIRPANYSQHLPLLEGYDLIIEAIAERLPLKKKLFADIAPHVSPHAVVASNTSGLSIDALRKVLPSSLQSRFCGVHFFNPPRYMHLVELIATPSTDLDVLDRLETFLTTALGKGVIRAHDTPNFIGNRIGVFSILAAMHHTARCKLSFEQVDAITGPLVGRPKSATYRTIDVVGLDTLAHVIETMAIGLPDDPWRDYFKAPSWLSALIAADALGQKSQRGIYRKRNGQIEVVDGDSGEYRAVHAETEPSVLAALQCRDWSDKFAALRQSKQPEAQFLWGYFRDLLHYCACNLEGIADNARDLDLAMRWGYGWELGPFELWQSVGWKDVALWIAADIAAGKAMSDTPLPAWVSEVDGAHRPEGAYAPRTGAYHGRPTLAVYQRQLCLQRMPGERPSADHTVFENDAAKLWHHNDGIAIFSLKTKQHVLGPDAIAALAQAIDACENDFDAMVVWHDQPPFSAGANLKAVTHTIETGDQARLATMVTDFQTTLGRLRTCAVPTVAAVQGLALGGGCELLMHCDRTVAAMESYIGLVEIGVGLLPSGGGLKELTVRAAEHAKHSDLFAVIQHFFELTARAKISGSAREAQSMGLLRSSDVIAMHPQELLYIAKAQARAMAETGYRAPLPEREIPVAGLTGIASLKAMLANMLEGHFITPHDNDVASRIATVLCGGEIDRGTLVDEDWLRQLERAHFLTLADTAPTRQRMTHMLKTGKPLRN